MADSREVLCPMCRDPRELLPVRAAATLAFVSPSTIRRWVRDGRLEYRLLPSGSIRILRSSLLRVPGITPSWLEWRTRVAAGTAPHSIGRELRQGGPERKRGTR